MRITQQIEASLEYTHQDTPTPMGRNIIHTFVKLERQVYTLPWCMYAHFSNLLKHTRKASVILWKANSPIHIERKCKYTVQNRHSTSHEAGILARENSLVFEHLSRD